jgi:hypothetical protein
MKLEVEFKRTRMKKYVIIIFGALAIAFYSCEDDTENIDNPIDDEPVMLNYDFETDDEGWDAGLTGYPVDEEELYDFNVEVTTSPVDDEAGVVLLSSANPDDENLFLYTSKHVSGLDPDAAYSVSFAVDLVPNVVLDTTGIGNDTIETDTNSNDTITIKAGAVSEEPATEADELDFLEFIGIDIGEPGMDGADLVVMGSFPADTTDAGYIEQTVSTENPISVTTNDDGELWLIVGAESSGSATEVYINSIEVEIER